MRNEYPFYRLVPFAQLLNEARMRGITVLPWPRGGKRIFIRHSAWEAGIKRRRQVTQGFATYREALRSFDHTIGSILVKSVFTQDLKRQFEEFGRNLRALHHDHAKTNFVEDSLPELILQLAGRRTGNLFEIKERLREEEGALQKSLLELVDESSWSAVYSVVIVRFGNLLDEERRRMVAEIRPRVEERELILGRIWEHQRRYARAFEKHLSPFVERAESARRRVTPVSSLLETLEGLLDKFRSPHSARLIDARQELLQIRIKVGENRLDAQAQRAWRSALTKVRNELSWLEQEDKQLTLFKGVA